MTDDLKTRVGEAMTRLPDGGYLEKLVKDLYAEVQRRTPGEWKGIEVDNSGCCKNCGVLITDRCFTDTDKFGLKYDGCMHAENMRLREESQRLEVENSRLLRKKDDETKVRECLWRDMTQLRETADKQRKELEQENAEFKVIAEYHEVEKDILIKTKNSAYSERNQLVAALTKIFPAWIERHPDSDTTWDKAWRNIIFISLPTGQVSWHIHDSEFNNFQHLPQSAEGVQSWDGHTTEEKYERLSRLENAALRKGSSRYERLRIIGCAPGGTDFLKFSFVLRFTNLDNFLDEDLKNYNRGEHKQALAAKGDEDE